MSASPRRRHRDGDEDYPCRASIFGSSAAEADPRRRSMSSPTEPSRRRRYGASPSSPNRRRGRDTSPSEDNRHSMPRGYADYHHPRSRVSDGGKDADRKRRRSRVSDAEREVGRLSMRAWVPVDEREDRGRKRCCRSSRTERELCPDDRYRCAESSRRRDDFRHNGSPADQRHSWDALREKISGLINKANATNIKDIVSELFAGNLVRGRGLFCESCIRSQMAAPRFTDVFAALVAAVNAKFPEICHLLLVRVVVQLKRALSRQDMPLLLTATKFIAHLVNQMVVHELLALELLKVLLENSTDHSVEVAVGFVKECGATLQLLSPHQLHAIFERFQCLLHEGGIDKRVMFLIQDLFTIRKANFKGYPSIHPELDLVERENKCTHEIYIEDELDPQMYLNFFRTSPNYIEDEKAYENIKKTILGTKSSEDEHVDTRDEDETSLHDKMRLYLTVMASAYFEEAGLMKIEVRPGQEMELCATILECCSQERTYLRYFGLLAQRYCMMKKIYQENFEKCFVQRYSMAHHIETNKLRNVAKFFAHLLETDTLPWHVLECIRLCGEETSSTRIFVKVLFQELLERLGIQGLKKRLNDPNMQGFFESIFSKDHPKNTMFAIKFFMAHGLEVITERQMEKMTPLTIEQHQPASSGSGSEPSSDDCASPGSDSEPSSDDGN